MAEYSKHQQKVIKRFYDNREAISLQRLQELVTELYLCEGKKLERQWKSLVLHLEKLEIPKQRIDHLVERQDPALVAELVRQLMAEK